jgi:hypothetical protein
VLVVVSGSSAWGQDWGDVNANAVVVGGDLTVEAQRPLDFQQVLPGADYDVDIVSSQSGRWRVVGTPAAEVQLTFLLPSFLFVDSYSLPIAFGPNQAGHRVINDPGGATRFDPNIGGIGKLRAFFGGVLFVWLGGTVSPTLSQQPGLYTGSVTLVVSYTGS